MKHRKLKTSGIILLVVLFAVTAAFVAAVFSKRPIANNSESESSENSAVQTPAVSGSAEPNIDYVEVIDQQDNTDSKQYSYTGNDNKNHSSGSQGTSQNESSVTEDIELPDIPYEETLAAETMTSNPSEPIPVPSSVPAPQTTAEPGPSMTPQASSEPDPVPQTPDKPEPTPVMSDPTPAPQVTAEPQPLETVEPEPTQAPQITAEPTPMPEETPVPTAVPSDPGENGEYTPDENETEMDIFP